MELEVVGPRVSVDRDGTGDRGGGQLILKQGKLLVRTRQLERALCTLPAIDFVQLEDLARFQASVRLVDRQVWNVHSEQGEDLTAFFRQVESAAGRPGMVREPPRISQLARKAATPARMRSAVLVGLALLAFLPLRWLSARALPVGVLLAVLGLAALLVLGAAYARRDEEGSGPLVRLRAFLQPQWPVVALVALLAGTLGFAEASSRATRQAAELRAKADEKQRAEVVAAHVESLAKVRRAEHDALAAKMQEALAGDRVREAAELRAELIEAAPHHIALQAVAAKLDAALAELNERERVAGIARGIAQAPVIAGDRLACETAKRVGDAVALLRAAKPSDADFEPAQRALEKLERCRQRVGARFAQSAEEGRRGMRVLSAAQIEAAVRKLGYPVNVTLSGRGSDVLRIQARELDARAAERILALNDASGAGFEAARSREGFARIEIRGEKLQRDVELQPLSAQALVVPVLEPFGLAHPLTTAQAP